MEKHMSSAKLISFLFCSVLGVLLALPERAVAFGRRCKSRECATVSCSSEALEGPVTLSPSKVQYRILSTQVIGQDKTGADTASIPLFPGGTATLSDNDGTLKFVVAINQLYPGTGLPLSGMYATVYTGADPEFPPPGLNALPLTFVSLTETTVTVSFTQSVGFGMHKIAIWAKYASAGETALSRTVGTLTVNMIP